ncbi:MAG: hypothetical protein LUI10_09070 [Lachnospiraceae bacterium]|nr:hypothetical protein [Lachnospiraceae bacterium]
MNTTPEHSENKLCEETKSDNLPVIAFGLLLGWLLYSLVKNELTMTLSDYSGHLYTYLPLFDQGTLFEGWKTVPYCMWHVCVLALKALLHIPLEESAAWVSSAFHLFSYLVIYWMILRFSRAHGYEECPKKAAFFAFGLSVVQGLYFDWLGIEGPYVGIFSINPLHNPTQTTVTGFALLCFSLVVDIWGFQENERYLGIFFPVQKNPRKYYLLLTLFLFLSAMAKPTFAEMFIPAVALIMLGKWISHILQKDRSASIYFKHCLNMLLCAVPTLLYILLQFFAYFIWGGSYGADGGLTVTKWLEVWSMFSDNVILSVALGMAFPLFMILIDSRFFVSNNLGRLSLTGYIIGFLEAALLGEGGSKLSHGDFLWPMMCGMLLLWVTAVLRFLVLNKQQRDTPIRRILLDIACCLLCLHIMFGLLFIKNSLLA